MSFSEFQADDRTIDAVLRNLEVIGEAYSSARDLGILGYPLGQDAALRNIVAHEHFGVRLPIISQTIERRLPMLKADLRRLR